MRLFRSGLQQQRSLAEFGEQELHFLASQEPEVLDWVATLSPQHLKELSRFDLARLEFLVGQSVEIRHWLAGLESGQLNRLAHLCLERLRLLFGQSSEIRDRVFSLEWMHLPLYTLPKLKLLFLESAEVRDWVLRLTTDQLAALTYFSEESLRYLVGESAEMPELTFNLVARLTTARLKELARESYNNVRPLRNIINYLKQQYEMH
jgi:hypothetical protein